jgi:phosphoribosylanthranilate isomerase
MTTTKIKFCGITSADDAELAVSLGAWAVGMIFWPGSPRVLSLQRAALLGQRLKRRTEAVGVFVNATLDEVVGAAEAAELTIVQLHGDEGPAFCAEIARRSGCRVIKAIRVHSGADIQALSAYHTDFHLLDSYVPGVVGGTGESFEWELATQRRQPAPPLILSGGLTPANVGAAIAAVHPYAVDVSSGVERAPGHKNAAAMRAFVEAVKATDAAATAADAEAPGEA